MCFFFLVSSTSPAASSCPVQWCSVVCSMAERLGGSSPGSGWPLWLLVTRFPSGHLPIRWMNHYLCVHPSQLCILVTAFSWSCVYTRVCPFWCTKLFCIPAAIHSLGNPLPSWLPQVPFRVCNFPIYFLSGSSCAPLHRICFGQSWKMTQYLCCRKKTLNVRKRKKWINKPTL